MAAMMMGTRAHRVVRQPILVGGVGRSLEHFSMRWTRSGRYGSSAIIDKIDSAQSGNDLRRIGCEILRVTNTEVLDNIESVWEGVLAKLEGATE